MKSVLDRPSTKTKPVIIGTVLQRSTIKHIGPNHNYVNYIPNRSIVYIRLGTMSSNGRNGSQNILVNIHIHPLTVLSKQKGYIT